MGTISSVDQAVKLIKRSKYIVAFTGAGISAESGIPTFRGNDGLWKRFRAEDLATPDAFSRNPRLVWEWYVWRMELISRAKPNEAHMVLADMEKKGIIKSVITQNVDGLHQRAGSSKVIELHGSIWRVRCFNPHCVYKQELKQLPNDIPPKCPICGNYLRPDVVWFGESLPNDAWSKATEEARRSDLILVIGTSGVVMPAAMIPMIAKENNAVVVEINIKPSALTNIADVFIQGGASAVMAAIKEKLGI